MNMNFNMKTGNYLGGLAAVALLAGCAVGPDYQRPATFGTNNVPAQFGDTSITNAGEWKTAAPAAQLPHGTWWTIYADNELNRLETLAASNNQQIAVALANYDVSRAALTVAQSGFYPQINATPSYTRQRNSSETFNSFNATAQASWELDLWGRLRRQSESARAQLAASAEDLESARLSVQAQVAADYFNLRSLDRQSQLLNETAAAYRKTLQLTQDRHHSGIADELDVAEAETQLKAAEAQIPAVDLQRAQERHALAVLCGQAAGTFALTPGTTSSTNPPAIPLAVPSAWLERRPDIAAAERSMAAANANIGVAKAAFYPSVTLNGLAGFESISASTLFDWPSRVWAVGPTLTLPLFTGGATHAQLASAKAAYREAVANYRQTVLAAFQNVEDELAGQTLLAVQLERESAALAEARRTYALSLQQYKAGILQYLNVITAQTTMLNYALSEQQLQGQRLVTSVNLILALGGTAEPVAAKQP